MTEANECVVRRIYKEILNEGQLAVAHEVIAACGIDHAPDEVSSLPTSSPRSLQAYVSRVCEAFPDAFWTIEELITTGDTVIVRTCMCGTQHEPFLGVPATGEETVVPSIDIVRIEDGKVVEHWGTIAGFGLPRRPRGDRHPNSRWKVS
jgi:predicted SnoaL-like aldol condensation-catalyzing enzyme